MSTTVKLMVIASLFVAGFLYAGRQTEAVLVICTWSLVFFLHRIEVKLNKLLDHYRISVTETELHE